MWNQGKSQIVVIYFGPGEDKFFRISFNRILDSKRFVHFSGLKQNI